MNIITIRAADAAHALDEAMRRLGPDALVLTTRQIDGQVELTAAPSGATAAPPEPPAPPPAPSGFSAELLRQLAADPAVQGVLPPHLPPRVVLTGPPGSGRSLLAARLAAAALRTPGAARPHLIAPQAERLGGPGRLALHARLMGLVADHPLWPPGRVPELPAPHADECQIVDLSALPEDAADTWAPLVALPGAALWLVLPTGLHPALHDRYVEALVGHVACLVLTRADRFPPTPEDIALPERFGLAVALHAQGTGLLDTLRPVTRPPRLPAASSPLPTEKADAIARLS